MTIFRTAAGAFFLVLSGLPTAAPASAQVMLSPGQSLGTGSPLLTEAAYNQVLRRRRFDLTRDQLIAVGEAEYRRLDDEMAALAHRIDPSSSWLEILRRFERTSHPRTIADLIPAYTAEVARARAFVVRKNLVTLPAAGDLRIVRMPPDLARRVAYAFYVWRDDVLYVNLDAGDDAETLSSNNDGLISVAAVHEAYPGHRTQNLIRQVPDDGSETMTEGWGLYSEELMVREGYYDGRPPAQRLFALRMLLYRAARALLDPKVHRGDLTPEEAVRFLVTRVGISEPRARIEVTQRYLTSPGSAATYIVGTRQIEQLRRQVQAKEGDRFTLKRFHDRLLAAGAAPVQTIAREVFHVDLESTAVPTSSADPAIEPPPPVGEEAILTDAAHAGPLETGGPNAIRSVVVHKAALSAGEIKYGRAPVPDSRVTYMPDVVIVEGGAAAIRALSADGVAWTIDAHAPRAADLAPGKIAFLTGHCMGRILFLKRGADTIDLVLGPVKLTDVFRSLEVDVDDAIDPADVVALPEISSPRVTLPLEGDAASLPEGSLDPMPVPPPWMGGAGEADRYQLRPVALAAYQRPVSPGIPQRVNLTFHTAPLRRADGIGAELRHEGSGIRAIAQVQLRAASPHLDFHLRIHDGDVTARMILKNTASLKLAFDGAVGEAFSGNVRWYAPAPGFSIPIGGPVPISVDVRQEIWVTTQFTARQSVFSAGGEYGINADLGFVVEHNHFTLIGPKGLTVERSLMQNMSGVSFGPQGIWITHQATVTGGLGAAGFTVGPTFQVITSLRAAQGSTIGIVGCRATGLLMLMRAGVGWTIPRVVRDVVNFFLDLVHVRRITDHDSISTRPVTVFNQRLQTDSAICGSAR
jgi:hypothetical protein